jgi:hypothetical protein
MPDARPSYDTLKLLITGSVIFFVICYVVVQVFMRAAPQPVATTPQTASSTASAAQEFEDLMKLSQQGNLVSSYNFSEVERVIYVSDVWFGLSVQFKKDFLAKVAMLQKAITGHHYFEVRNDRSNEKVGEVTAFSGSLEVYK